MTCLSSARDSPLSICGGSPNTLQKLIEIENDNFRDNETWRNNREANKDEILKGACTKNDTCCIHRIDAKKSTFVTPYINRDEKTKIAKCTSGWLSGSCQWCTAVGNASLFDCVYLFVNTASKFGLRSLVNKVQEKINKIGCNGTYLNLDKEWLNMSNLSLVNMQEDFKFEKQCGWYFQQAGIEETRFTDPFCNVDSCETHLASLHFKEKIFTFEEWKHEMKFDLFGTRVGGKICRVLQTYGYAMIIPILINYIFHLIILYLDLKCGKADRYEILPALLFVYPQWVVLKLLFRYLIHKDEKTLNKEKECYERNVETLEAFLEATFQVKFLLRCL